jgi:hypothetical protein
VSDLEPRRAVPAQRTSHDQAAAELRAVGQTSRQLHVAAAEVTDRAVMRLRVCGGSWADVGHALGLSRATAHRRFHHVDRDWSVALTVVANDDGTRRAGFALVVDGQVVEDVTDLLRARETGRAIASELLTDLRALT